jgi:hypothetical protein
VVEFEPGHVTAEGVALALEVEELLDVVDMTDDVLELTTDEVLIEEDELLVVPDVEEVLELVVADEVLEDALEDEEDELLMSLAPQTPLLTGEPTEDLR